MTTTTTETKKITITMSERRPLSIVKADWPSVTYGEHFDFQSFDGVWVRVRQHSDGRAVVYGYAGDWRGGGRPGREDRRAGFLVEAGGDIVRAIRRVAGILAETDNVGEMAHVAARRCIADLPAEEPEEPGNQFPEPVSSDARVAVPAADLATLLALLVQARPHCPAALQEEIRAVLGGQK